MCLKKQKNAFRSSHLFTPPLSFPFPSLGYSIHLVPYTRYNLAKAPSPRLKHDAPNFCSATSTFHHSYLTTKSQMPPWTHIRIFSFFIKHQQMVIIGETSQRTKQTVQQPHPIYDQRATRATRAASPPACRLHFSAPALQRHTSQGACCVVRSNVHHVSPTRLGFEPTEGCCEKGNFAPDLPPINIASQRPRLA